MTEPEIRPLELYLGRAHELAESIVNSLGNSPGYCPGESKKLIVFAESCTAGLAADFIVRIPGASNVFWGSFVSYRDDAKLKMLGVPEELINRYGAVSRQVAIAMAEGALEKSGTSMAVSITGLAGPDGDEKGTPIGTVWIGLTCLDESSPGTLLSGAKGYLFSGERNELREAAATAALELLLDRLTKTWL